MLRHGGCLARIHHEAPTTPQTKRHPEARLGSTVVPFQVNPVFLLRGVIIYTPEGTTFKTLDMIKYRRKTEAHTASCASCTNGLDANLACWRRPSGKVFLEILVLQGSGW